MITALLNPYYRNTMQEIPTFRDFFDQLVDQKKKEIKKASDEDAFEAAKKVVADTCGFVPDFGFKAYKTRKNSKRAKN